MSGSRWAGAKGAEYLWTESECSTYNQKELGKKNQLMKTREKING